MSFNINMCYLLSRCCAKKTVLGRIGHSVTFAWKFSGGVDIVTGGWQIRLERTLTSGLYPYMVVVSMCCHLYQSLSRTEVV